VLRDRRAEVVFIPMYTYKGVFFRLQCTYIYGPVKALRIS